MVEFGLVPIEKPTCEIPETVASRIARASLAVTANAVVPASTVARSMVEFGLVPIEKPTPEISETVASRTVEPAPSVRLTAVTPPATTTRSSVARGLADRSMAASAGAFAEKSRRPRSGQ